MAALREILAHFGIEVDDKKLKAADSQLGDFVGKLKQTARVAAEAFAVYEIVNFAKSVADAGQHIANQAVQLGVSAEYVQQLGFASQAAGQDTEFLVTSMGRLQYAAVEAGRSGASPSALAFQKLGVHVKDASGKMKDADALFSDVADAMVKLKNPTERAATATDLFGRAGRVLLPFLTRGSAGIRELQEDFQRLGGGLSPDAIKKAAAFEKAWARIRLAIEGIKSRIFEAIGPPLTWIIDHLASATGWFARMVEGTDAVRDALIAVGLVLAPFAFELAAAFAPLIVAGAAIAGIYLLFDDLIGLFEGKESVIGEVMDKLGGKGTSTAFVKEMKEEWQNVKNAIEACRPVLDAVWEVVKLIAHDVAEIVKDAVSLGGGIGNAAFNAVQVVTGKANDTLTGNQMRNLVTGDTGVQVATMPERQFGVGAGGANVNQTNNMTFQITGNLDAAATGQAVKEHVAEALDAQNRDAHQVLAKRVSQ